MAANAQKLTAVFLYSRKDEAFRRRFADYLEMLQSGPFISKLSYQDIESLSPFRFEQVIEEADLFIFACSVHLFAHPKMRKGVFRRLAAYHHTGRLRVVAISCRPWKLEDTVLKSVIHLPADGRAVNSTEWDTEDEAFLCIFNSLQALCEEWQKEKVKLENSWEQAQMSHEVEAYHAFLEDYPHSRYSEEARNLADNLSEQELWVEAEEKKNLLNYFRYMHSPYLQKEHQETAALNITRIEKDEEKNWADTVTQKGPEFFFRYKAMFPAGKYVKEADKQIGKFLKKPAALAAGHSKASESLYLAYLAYKRLPPEEFFSLSFYLSYWGQLEGRLERLSDALSRKPLRYLIYILLAILLVFSLFSLKVEDAGAGPFSFGWLMALLAFVFGFVLYHLARYRLKKDRDILAAFSDALMQDAAFLKVGFLTNDLNMVRETLNRLTRIEREIAAIEQKNFLDYLFPPKKYQEEWEEEEEEV